jgi:hypothetical protein
VNGFSITQKYYFEEISVIIWNQILKMMETKYKVTIPKPCHEDWNTMTPEETGRFCNSCIKSVVDFTSMKAPEINAFFRAHEGEKICGRFKKEQVATFCIYIPQRVLRQNLPFHKTFLLVLFIVMGTSLFSCKNHDDAVLGEIVVVKDTAKVDQTLTGDTLYTPIDSVEVPKIMGMALPPKKSSSTQPCQSK